MIERVDLVVRVVSAFAVAVSAVAAAVVSAVGGASAGSAVPSNVQRIAGPTRIETAIAASADQFPAAGSAKAVVLARSDDFPDALAGGPLAAKVGGPLLLTPPAGLDPAVRTEILRVVPKGSTVYVLGGQAAISPDVDSAVAAAGYVAKRVAGADRYATAVAIADQLGDPTTVFEATGWNFPDALAGVPAAIKTGGAILLTMGDAQSAATAAYLRAHPGGTHYALGGPAAKADPAAKAFIGVDRYDTAAEVADQFFPGASSVGAATGEKFPDALAAGPDVAARDAPLLLVPSVGAVPPRATAEILFDFMTCHSAVVFGGTNSVSDQVATQLGVLAGAGPAAAAASRSSTWTARYGVRAENTGAAARTVVIDGNTGDVTTYVAGTTSTARADQPTRSQLATVPLDPVDLETSVNSLYSAYDSKHGISDPDPDRLFVWNAEQVLLDPVASPSLRLATFSALAGLGITNVESQVGDSTGRVGVAITAPRGSGTVRYLVDVSAFVPLEHVVYGPGGTVVSLVTITSMSTSSTMPSDPYSS